MNDALLTLLNLDGTYETQSNLLKKVPHQWVELGDIQGKNLYCDDLAFQQISTRLSLYPRTPITLIGSGNYHYISYYYLSQIHEPFTLILVDHHTDMLEQEQWLTCGSWVARALRTLPQLDQVIMIGVSESSIANIEDDLNPMVCILKEQDLSDLPTIIKTSSVYLSIDKDAFSESVVKTNWNQGTLSLDVIHLLLQRLSNYQLTGIGICGEWPVAPEERLLSINQIYAQKNEKANFFLINTISNKIPMDIDSIKTP